MRAPSLIGIISDTHGLLRPEAVHALAGSHLIIHAGDVGKLHVLDSLRAIAPVVAVRGNVDRGDWAQQLPTTAAVEADGALIYVLHDVHELGCAPIGCDIVISGHSHKLGREERDGVLYLNPGAAGPRRFRLPITVARLDLRVAPWDVRFVEL